MWLVWKIIIGLSLLMGKSLAGKGENKMVNKKESQMSFESRLEKYSIVSNRLACLSDMELNELLKTATQLSVGYGENVTLNVDGIPVFIKKVPLTDLERKPENVRSTANIFNLPMFYQYGIGSAGFGAWRELAVNIMITNWVLTDQCENFPLMYHFRVLPGSMPKVDDAKQAAKLEKDAAYWDNSSAVQDRLQALTKTSAFVVIFLENIPIMLATWLDEQFAKGPDAVDAAVIMIEKNLETTTAFMADHGMYHFDAHFYNIMTDGCRLYFADMGLAACSTFALSPEEKAFFQKHRLFDTFYTKAALAAELAERLVTSYEECKKMLQEYGSGKQDMIFSPTVTSMLKKYAPNAVLRDEFFSQLSKVSKSTSYPAQAIEALCNRPMAKSMDEK